MTPLLLLAALLAGAAPVHTDATTQARAHFKAATDAYRRADYQTAIAEFEAAYAAKPAPVLRYNLAQCYERSGDIPSALKSYHQYLHESPAAEDRATVQVAIGNLERRLQERGVQQLLVYSEPPAAAVTIDGTNRGTTPTSMELAPGLHQVRVALPGYAVADRQVSISPDKSLELDFALQAQSAAPPTPAADLTPREAAPERTTPAAQTPQVEAKPSHPRVFTFVAAGVCGLAAAGAVGLGLSASSSASRLTDGTIRNGASAQALHDDAQSKARSANILYGVAGLAGVAAATLFVVEGSF